ncbi:MAG TPA: DUF1761 domain-containing protein [Candidatus Thermoplasmatota archaeon]|nr:DUF1761 domain-containing protein [Candidatus Thermoplasmatota archaeon]
MPDPLPVLAAGALTFLLGGLWYSPAMFARAWVPLAHPGKSMEDLRREGAGAGGYVLAFLGGLVGAAVVGAVAQTAGGGLADGLAAGTAVGVAVLAAMGVNNHFGGRPRRLWLIDGGYQALGLILAGLVYGIWPT